jgi:hypothetical protein
MAPPIWGLGDGWSPVHQRSRPLRRAPSWRLPASGKPANDTLSKRKHSSSPYSGAQQRQPVAGLNSPTFLQP